MACQNSAHASGASCASATLPPRAAQPTFAEGGAQIHISPAVIDKVSELLAEEGDSELKLRIYVTGGGCSGFQYGFAFDDAPKDDDFRVERGPVTVLVDAMSLQYLQGAEIDFEDSLEGARFVIRNPNAASTCGCGSSFTVAS
jgi:iron-sulfur cluster insertion protein